MKPSLSYAERRRLQLRDEIIEAAFDVFAERGYHDLGVTDITDRTSTSQAAVQLIFDGIAKP
jgi:AcrR family transcriptional regulator